MKRNTKVLFFLIFLLIFAMSMVMARNLDRPVRMGSNPIKMKACTDAGLDTNYFNECSYEYQVAWAAYGGGWNSFFRGGNTKTDGSIAGGIALQIQVLGLNTTDTHRIPYMRTNRNAGIVVGGTIAQYLEPGELYRVEFLYPAVTEDGGYTAHPDPTILTPATLRVQYSAPPEHLESLKGLALGSVSFLEKDANGNPRRNATEPVMPPSEYWRGQFSETYRHADMTQEEAQVAETTSMAICNPNELPIIIDITLHDDKGALVASVGMQLRPHESRGFLLRDIFGEKMFPGLRSIIGTVTVSRREWSVLNPGEYQGTNVVMFQSVGDYSMGSLPMWPIAKPIS